MGKVVQVSAEDAKALFDVGIIEESSEEINTENIEGEGQSTEDSQDNEESKGASEETSTEEVKEEVSADDFFISDSGIDDEGAKVEDKKEEPKKTEKKKVQVPFVNDKQKAIYNAIKQNPDVDLAEVGMMFNKGYEKMSMETLIKTDIQNDPDNEGLELTQKKIDFLYKERVNNILARLDPDDDDFEESRDLLLAREANRIKRTLDVKREQMIASLNQEVEFDAEVEATEQMSEEQIALERQNLVNSYAETFEPMLKSGILKIQDRDGVINVPVHNKEKIAEAAADPVAFLKGLILNEKGEVNFNKFIGVVNYALNPRAYNATLISHGITQGKGGLIKEIKNIKTPDSRAAEAGMQTRKLETPEDLKEAFEAKFGKRY
jgi:hypothetical protein